MLDAHIKMKNRIHATHDLNTLWKRLRKEGYMVYEDEDYESESQAPYHLMHIETADGKFMADTLYRDHTAEELNEARELGLTPFLQHIEWVEY